MVLAGRCEDLCTGTTVGDDQAIGRMDIDKARDPLRGVRALDQFSQFIAVDLDPVCSIHLRKYDLCLPPRRTQVDIDEDAPGAGINEVLQRRGGLAVAGRQAAVVKQSTQRYRGDGFNRVPGRRAHDVVLWLVVDEGDRDLAGGQCAIDLQLAHVHAPVAHGRLDLSPEIVVTDPADHPWRLAEGLQVPGDIEWGAAKHAAAIREAVEKDLAEDAGLAAVHASTGASNPIQSVQSGW